MSFLENKGTQRHPNLLKALRIFIVEDDDDNLEWLTRYLEALGHTVASARSVAAARENLPKAQYDMLISDLNLPDGTGWDLLQSVELPYPIYAIAASGSDRNEDRARSKAVGFRHQLLKPTVSPALDAALKEAVHEAAART